MNEVVADIQSIKALPVTFEAALTVKQVPGNEVPGIPDRIIDAPAVEQRLDPVSSDTATRWIGRAIAECFADAGSGIVVRS